MGAFGLVQRVAYSRTAIEIMVGTVIVGGLAYVLWPSVQGPRKTQAEIRAGLLPQVISRADNNHDGTLSVDEIQGVYDTIGRQYELFGDLGNSSLETYLERSK